MRVGGARNGKGKGEIRMVYISGQVLCVSAGMFHGGNNQIAASVNELLKSLWLSCHTLARWIPQ